MASNYEQFSEAIPNITPEEKEWLQRVLNLEIEDDEDFKTIRQEFPDCAREGDWPGFNFKFDEDGDFWFYAEEVYNEINLVTILSAFLKKFRPETVLIITIACSCSKPRIGEFGGGWLAISAKEYAGGNTWDAAKEAAKILESELQRGCK